VRTTANAAGTGLTYLPKHVGAQDKKLLVTYPMAWRTLLNSYDHEAMMTYSLLKSVRYGTITLYVARLPGSIDHGSFPRDNTKEITIIKDLYLLWITWYATFV
jgi:hypothetical protein